MAWDSVPWMVGGGAQHSPEVGRVLAYAAFNGNEGIIGSGDLKVSALSTPAGSVNIAPGACSVLSRASGAKYQAYAGRLQSQDTLVVPGTGGTVRSDLIVARVEDPFVSGEPYSNPSDPTVGPYIFSRVISNVPKTTTNVLQLGKNYSAVALARIDWPANTSVVQQGMIVDLRNIANPRRQRQLYNYNGTLAANPADNLTAASPTGKQWPAAGGAFSVDVPTWATQAFVIVSWGQVQANGNATGNLWFTLGTVAADAIKYDNVNLAGSVRQSFTASDVLAIPSALRGTTQTLKLMGSRDNTAGQTISTYLQTDYAVSLTVDVEFRDGPE